MFCSTGEGVQGRLLQDMISKLGESMSGSVLMFIIFSLMHFLQSKNGN